MLPATRFGPYEIIRRLGKSMNDVYLARDTREDRQAALKLIKSGPDAVSRLILESERRGAEIQQRLRSLDPRVIEIYDFGDLDGYFYVAMQYVEGRNLAEVLQGDGRMSAFRAAHIAMEICGQLAKFHGFQPGDGTTTSVVHGDIKPSNIHLGLNETVRLLDFGIAKALRPNHDFTFHNFGSPSYCSPERLGRSLVDQQADLWAVGVTLYEMVAGAPPYQAEDTRKLERLIQSRRPPRALPASCPPVLKAVITKALAPDAGRRYLSAAAFGADLQAFLEGRGSAAENEQRSPWKPNPTRESARVFKPRRAAPARKTLRIAARAASALAYVLAGMLLFIATSYFARYWTASRQLRAHLDYAHRPLAEIDADWSYYQDLIRQFGFLGRYSPVDRLRPPLRAAYEQAGAQVLAAYESGSDANLRHFDWRKAEICLTRAMDLGASDRETHARLSLARGYTALERAAQRGNAHDRFLEAAHDLPQWPDPHLALARIELLDSQPDRALAEFHSAERLGCRLGSREIAQQAEAYRMRGFDELQAGDSTAARGDFDAAHKLNGAIRIPDIPPPDAAPRAHHKRARRGASFSLQRRTSVRRAEGLEARRVMTRSIAASAEPGSPREQAGNRWTEAGSLRAAAGNPWAEAGGPREQPGNRWTEPGSPREQAGNRWTEAGSPRERAGSPRAACNPRAGSPQSLGGCPRRHAAACATA